VGYHAVEVVGCLIERRARGRGFGAQNRKPSGGGSAFVNKVRGGLDLDSGRSVEAG
jgi:hypothetical protein